MIDPTFHALVAPFNTELRLHCYRMLGSSHDSEDMVQETLVRAWRAQESLNDRQAARSWLYRIATNVCLDELARRPKRALPAVGESPAEASADPLPAREEWWVEPCPSSWLSGVMTDPATKTEMKESIALAFVVALQVLTPPQRAVLLLRDVVGLSAEEAAQALGMTVPAANSALHRARTAVKERDLEDLEEVDEDLLERYVRAWETADVDALVALVADDVTLVMPPAKMWFSGRAALEAFFRHRVVPRPPSERARFVRCDANGQPAFGFYRGPKLVAVHVVTTRRGRVVAIDQFFLPSLFPIFGLSPTPPTTPP
jgi:RNA polymerase sigma-70 factor, ECF subfamily